jgi:hypothetical protein
LSLFSLPVADSE